LGLARVPRIALVVDHPQRDLDGLVLGAAQLAKAGADVFLVPMYHKHEAQLLGPDVVLLNYVRPANLPFLLGCRALGISVAVLDTEGGVVGDPADYAARIERYLPHVNLYLAWGEAQSEAVRPHAERSDTRVEITGCPRYDFTASPWRDALERPAAMPTGPVVLVNTNFPLANPRFKSAEEEKGEMVRMGFTRQYADDRLAQTRIARDELVGSVRTLASRLPEISFVLRPHPFENRSSYDRDLAGLPNVVVAQEGPVFPWVRYSAALLHHNCSTAIEAFLMGVEPVHAGWIPGALLANDETQRVSTVAPDLDAAQSRLAALASGKDAPAEPAIAAERQRVVHRFFHSGDGRASRRVADALLRLSSTRADRRPISVWRLLGAQPDARRKLRTALVLALGSAGFDRMRASVGGRQLSGDKSFTADDVAAVLERIARAESGLAGLTARPAGRRLTSVRVARA
jgi:surface carbohydrate biosynthesis protein